LLPLLLLRASSVGCTWQSGAPEFILLLLLLRASLVGCLRPC
jgi:hypothetical protein